MIGVRAAVRALLPRWQPGRQRTGYDKLPLASATWPIPFDSWLLRYPPGALVPPHTDPVTTGRHYRLNVVLRAAGAGGEFVCASPLLSTRRIKLFRPDLCEHAVTRVEGRTRYVLSVGWVLGASSGIGQVHTTTRRSRRPASHDPRSSPGARSW